jgi:hypothetical protein
MIYHDVSSYSGYTKGIYEVVDVAVEQDSASLTFIVPVTICAKLDKRVKKFQSNSISLDGVAANAIIPNRQCEPVYVIATIAKDIFKNSSLSNIRIKDHVSIGLLSVNPEKYLLDASRPSKVQFKSLQVLEGNIIEFLFECTEEQFRKIQGLQYIGLNGSAFFLKDPKEADGHFYFSVHSYGDTDKKTIFNDANRPVNTEFTLTLPFAGNS